MLDLHNYKKILKNIKMFLYSKKCYKIQLFYSEKCFRKNLPYVSGSFGKRFFTQISINLKFSKITNERRTYLWNLPHTKLMNVLNIYIIKYQWNYFSIPNIKKSSIQIAKFCKRLIRTRIETS